MPNNCNYLNETFDISKEDLTSSWDEVCLWSSYFGAILLDTVKFLPNANILDIGCGTGFPLLEIAQRFGKSSHITGIDPWAEAVNRLHYKAKAMNVNNYDILVQKAEELPFKNGNFDIIVSNVGINNVEDPSKVISECSRVCKQNGQLVMTTNLPETMIEFYNVFRNVLNASGLTKEISLLDKHISAKRMTLDENVALIQSGGFIINNIKAGSFKLRFLNGTAFLNHHFIKLAFLPSWKIIVPADLLETVFSTIENNLNELALKDGELALTVPYACFDCIKP
ncbi:MAG: class I SAM-dependent methyltransferase [Bacteroidota bacterium]|nr:class I SAM-dependent methyltransferase [Bacteroidota bacterium]